MVIVFGFFSTMTGCSGQKLPNGMPKLYPCQLTITMDGSSLSEASVSLIPAEGNNNTYTAGGTTDQNGNVTIMVNGQFIGAPLGKYHVLVVKTLVQYKPGFEPENIKITPSGDESQDRKTRLYAAQDYATNVDLVAPVFGSVKTTPLIVEIVAGKNAFKQEVKSASSPNQG